MMSDTSSEKCLPDTVCEGDYVLVYIDRRRRHVFRVRRGGRYSSDKGYIDHDMLIGLRYGSVVTLSSGVRAYILRPSLEDLVMRVFKRPTQIIYPKDLGRILVRLDIQRGRRVLESGVGSGAATAFLARAVAPEGRVYGYEIRREFAETAIENLSRIGLERYVEIKVRDVAEGVDERDLDSALIDLPDPWRVVDVVYDALRPGAPVAFFIPTIEQIERLYNKLVQDEKWADIEILELLERTYETKINAIRPRTTMIGHTGYIVFARKILKS